MATRALLSPDYAKLRNVPTVENAEEASAVLGELLDAGLFLRCRSTNNTRFMQPEISRQWADEALYAWIYEGSQLFTIIGSLLLLVFVLGFMLFPLWPNVVRSKASYLINFGMYGAIGIVIFLVGLSVVRMIVYLVTYFTAKPGLWIFPNLWADCGVIESFKPVWDWDRPDKDSSSSSKHPNVAPLTDAGTPLNGSDEKKTN
jgi:translocation protein SEC62